MELLTFVTRVQRDEAMDLIRVESLTGGLAAVRWAQACWRMSRAFPGQFGVDPKAAFLTQESLQTHRLDG